MKNSKKQNRNSAVYFKTVFFAVIVFTSIFIISPSCLSQNITDTDKYLNNTGASDIKSITEISLNNKDLNTIPEKIFEMTSLETLDLQNNPIEILPSNIRFLQNLRVLNLTNTSINELPEELSRLIHLKEIHLDYMKWELKLDKIKRLTRAEIILE